MFLKFPIPRRSTSLRSKFWIFGIGYGCRLILLFSSHKRSNSDLRVSSWVFGNRHGQVWCGSTLSFNLMLYGVLVNVLNVPSNRSSYFFRSLSSDCCSLLVRQSAFVAISSRFALYILHRAGCWSSVAFSALQADTRLKRVCDPCRMKDSFFVKCSTVTFAYA